MLTLRNGVLKEIALEIEFTFKRGGTPFSFFLITKYPTHTAEGPLRALTLMGQKYAPKSSIFGLNTGLSVLKPLHLYP